MLISSQGHVTSVSSTIDKEKTNTPNSEFQGDVTGISEEGLLQSTNDEITTDIHALAIVPINVTPSIEGMDRVNDKGKSVIVEDIIETDVDGGESSEQQKICSPPKIARHLDVVRVLQTIPQVDTKKMHKQFEAKEKRGMGDW